MKVIIVGAGVAGLASYLQLRKLLPPTSSSSSHDITIYESHHDRTPPPSAIAKSPDAGSRPAALAAVTDSAEVVGNMIALTPATMRVLRYIDEGLYRLFLSRGCQNKTYVFNTARGHSLGMRDTGDDGQLPTSEHTVSCPRAVLRRCLLEIVGETNVQYDKVVSVNLVPGSKPVVRFADGRQESADLVLGADGVRSVVKTAVLGPEQDAAARFSPHYEGFCGVGGFLKMDRLPACLQGEGKVVFTFGPTGSFGYCLAAPEDQRTIGWWSNWGRSRIPQSNIMDADEIRRQLHDRHGDCHDPIIRHIVETSTTDRIYPIWTTPDLPAWSAHGAVLLGDAAHTLPATSGQGAGQALEDSVIFSLLLSHYMVKAAEDREHGIDDAQAVQLAARGLFEIQAPRVAAIKRRSRNLYLTKKRIVNIFFEYIYYLYLYLLVNVPILSNVILGSVFDAPDDLDLEERVQRYLNRGKNTKRA